MDSFTVVVLLFLCPCHCRNLVLVVVLVAVVGGGLERCGKEPQGAAALEALSAPGSIGYTWQTHIEKNGPIPLLWHGMPMVWVCMSDFFGIVSDAKTPLFIHDSIFGGSYHLGFGLCTYQESNVQFFSFWKRECTDESPINKSLYCGTYIHTYIYIYIVLTWMIYTVYMHAYTHTHSVYILPPCKLWTYQTACELLL